MIGPALLTPEKRLEVARAMVDVSLMIASVKSIPRGQRELEGKAARLSRGILDRVFEEALKYLDSGQMSPIRAFVIAQKVRAPEIRTNLYSALMTMVRSAAAYGKNRMVQQVQRVPGPPVRHGPMTTMEMRSVTDGLEGSVDRALSRTETRLRTALMDADRARGRRSVESIRESWSNAIGREVINDARSSAEYETAVKFGARWMWVDSDDSRVRSSHRRVNGEVVRVGEPFTNGLRYPRDRTGALNEIMGCRCRTEIIEARG